MDFHELEELRNLAPKNFFQAISKTFGIDPNSLERLLEDYDLEPKEAYGPQDHEAVPLLMRQIAARVGLPVKVVGRLQDIGAIGAPITCGDFEFLKSYKTAWGNSFLIKTQLANYSRKQREEIMNRPELATKWEKWTYTKYVENEISRGHGNRMIYPEKRIMVENLAETIEEMFGVPNCENTRARIRKIREMAYNDKKSGNPPKKRF